MKRRFLLPLASCFWILTSPSAHALIDTNTNGLPDLWEKAFNSNALFSASNPAHAPSADPDGDGWTNLQESTAGTNPFSSAAPHGILTPAIGYTPAIREPAPPGAEIGQPGVVTPPLGTTDPFAGGAGSSATFTEPLEIRRPARFTLTWQPVVGKAYRIEQSTDLATWQPTTGFYMGGAVPITYQGEAILSDNTEPPKLFYRLKIEDADNDSDSLTDYEETLLGTDPYSADTDRDGIADNLDPQPLINALQATWDADATAPSGATLFAAFNFTPPASAGYPFTAERVTDISGSTRNGKARTQSGGLPVQQNPPQDNAEGIANQGFHCANTHHFAFEQKNPGINFAPVSSLSFWLKSKTSDLTGNGQPIFSYAPRTAVFAQSGNTSNPYAARAFIRKQATGSAYEVVWLNWTFPGNIVRERWTLDLTEFQINQRWINLTFVWQGTGSGQGAFWACYANGIKQNRTLGSSYRFQTTPTTANTPQDTFVIGADAAGGSSQNNLATIQSTFKGSMDRIRLHSTALSIAQVQAINAQDTDRDGLWDSTEASATTWKDTNANSKRDPGEIRYPNGSPIFWQPATNDADGDGLTDLVEQSIGTRIDHTDTDGDRLPDGWEVRFTLSPLDATGANGRDGDPDGDGLLNINEYRYASKPKPLPGDPAPGQPGSATDSDGDVTGDNAEFTGNSHPGNASDGGQPLAASEKISVFLAIGDESTSHSEDYSLEVSVIDPETGEEEHFHTLHAEGFGQYKSGTIDKFQKGHTYTFRILWNGTNRTDSQGPDFDYTCKIEPQGTGSGFLIDSYDVSSSTANLAAKLTGNNLNDVATDEEDFRAKYRHRRAVLMGVSTVSADRMFGASMQVLPGLENIQLEIKNTTTNEDFGTHSQLFVNAYESYEAILGHGDNFGKNVSDPRVWFIKDEQSTIRSIQAYLCTDPAKELGEITIAATFRGIAIGNIKRSLSGNPAFGQLLGITNAVASGTGLGFPSAIGGVSPGGVPVVGKAHHWAAALNIPILILHQLDENTTLLATGIYNGFIAGLADDAEFVVLVVQGNVAADLWLRARAIAYLHGWATDPTLRLRQLKDAITGFVAEYVCKPAAAISYKLSSPSQWISTFWEAQVKAQAAFNVMKAVALQGLWSVVAGGAADWWEDFSRRMMYESEALVANADPFPTSALLSGAAAFQTTAAYTLGYCTGYLTEQVAVGYATAGGITIGKILLSGGVRISAKLATRTTATIAAKYSWLRAYVRESPALANAVERELYRKGIVLYATEPTTPVIKEPAAQIIQKQLLKPGFDVAKFNQTSLTEALLQGNLRKLSTSTAGENLVRKRTAQLIHLLGNEADAIAIRNYLKAAERLVKEHADGTIEARFLDLFELFKAETPEGAKALAKSLREFNDGNGKFWIRDIDQVYSSLYHHFPASGFNRLEIRNGSIYLTEFAGERGWYVTAAKIDTQQAAKDLLQLPSLDNGRYRCKFSTTQAKNNLKGPRGEQNQSETFEFLAKDFPQNGSGGESQILLEAKEVLVDEIFDTVEQRNLSIIEIQQLINQ